MKKHPELTIGRINNFLQKLKKSYYGKRFSLKAECATSPEPVKFEKVKTLDFHPIEEGEKWGDGFDCAWFKIKGKVPAEFRNHPVVALIDIGGEACIFDKNGVPIQGLTSGKVAWENQLSVSKRRSYLLENAVGGEEIELLIEAGANNLMGICNYENKQNIANGFFNYAHITVFKSEAWQS